LIAKAVEEYLHRTAVPYEVVAHPRTRAASETARRAHIRGAMVAKAVILADDAGYLMAAIPATHYVHLSKVNRALCRPLGIAAESTLARLFPDCEFGAVPALGMPYAIDMIIDESLFAQPSVYLEGGDHVHLLHIAARHYESLVKECPRGSFSRPMHMCSVAA
jgi:Ala-tRNA(Pro) deacylase